MTPSAAHPTGATGAAERTALGWWAAAAVLAVYVGLALVARLPGIGVGNDDATYFFLAKALLQGTYRDLYLPAAPLHVQYPPGWPLALAIPLGLFGDRPEILLLLPLAFSVGGLLLLFAASRRVLPPFPAIVVLVLASFNPLMITYGGRLKAEAAFFFFAMLALWALAAPDASRRRLLLGSAAAIASAFMRSAGVAVIAAVFLHFALARRWRWAGGFGLAAALTFGPWLAWSFLGPRQVVGRSYVEDLVKVEAARAAATGQHPLVSRLAAAWARAKLYAFGHLHAVMGFKQASGTLADNIGWLLTLAIAGTAGTVTVWRRLRPAVLILAALCAVLVAWAWADRRFLHPVAPLVALILVSGGYTIGRRFGRVGAVVGPLVVAGLLTPGTLRFSGDVMARGIACDAARAVETCYTPVERAFLEGALAARTLPDSAVVLVQRDAAFAYHSGRTSEYAYEATEREDSQFAGYLEEHHITHIMISRVARGEPIGLAARLVAICGRLQLVGDFGYGTALFKVGPAGPGQAGTGTGSVCELTTRIYEEAQRLDENRPRAVDVFEIP